MKILMISRGIPSENYPQWGCFEKDQAEALAAIGHEVVVLSVDARYQKKRGKLGLHHIKHNGIDFYNYVMLPGVLFSKVLGDDIYYNHIKYTIFDKLFRRISDSHGRPDLIYSQFFGNTVMAVKLKSKFNIPVVAIEHLARFNEPKLTVSDYKWSSYAFTRVDCLIAVAGTLADNIKKRFGIDCSVVHNMYGSEFANKDIVVPDKKEHAPLIFVATASLVYRKGFDVLIKAFAKIRHSKSEWKLNIIGGGEEKNNLQHLIDSNGLNDNIKLLGQMTKSQIVDHLHTSNVFVLPSRNENFSVAVLEGLALGLPVIATDCGGIRECINSDNGVIVPVDNVTALAEALDNMIDNYANYNLEGIVHDCQMRFSPAAIAHQLTQIFSTTLAK